MLGLASVPIGQGSPLLLQGVRAVLHLRARGGVSHLLGQGGQPPAAWRRVRSRSREQGLSQRAESREQRAESRAQVNIRPPLGLSRRVALSGISNVEEYGLFKF